MSDSSVSNAARQNFSPTFFNTLTRKIEQVILLDENHLKMYVCGPTVYDRPHIGNARSAVVYDLFFRLFLQLFKQVSYVRNITDVDDKINLAAKKRGISINQLTQEITEIYHQDIGALNVLRPTFEPKVTENIPEIIQLISKLLAQNAAYESNGHVLFDVKSYANYGQLSNRKVDEMIAGARVEVGEYKKNPLDFVLWKPADAEDDISSIFESPWGLGRPGWHIECSAMSLKFLGADFDIHGGGADLQFPHHENEIAQTCAAFPEAGYARYWIHNGFLTVNGEKMSKSLNNFITVRDLLDRKISGAAIRLMLLATHYRKPLDFNDKTLADAQKNLLKFQNAIKNQGQEVKSADFLSPSIEILRYLCEDLNIAKVIAFLHESANKIKDTNSSQEQLQLASDLNFLGLLSSQKNQNNSVLNLAAAENKNAISSDFIEAKIALRAELKSLKNFTAADQIRQELAAKGVAIEDLPQGKSKWHLI